MEITLQDVNEAVQALQTELKRVHVDVDKVERIQEFLDTHEEKYNQPLVAAQTETKQLRQDMTELQERLEQAGVSEREAKERVDALELELARRGDQVTVDYREKPEFKAYEAYIRQGFDQMDQEHKALLRTDSSPDGGFLVTTEMAGEILRKIVEVDPIRSVARVRTIGAKSVDMPVRNTIPTATYEGEADTGGDSTSAYENINVVPFRQTYTCPITRDMLQDAAFDMESEIMSDGALAFAYGEGNGFVVGTGHKQPQGFMVNATLQAGARETAASGVLDPEAIILLTGDLKVGYSPVYVMNRRTLAKIRTFRADAVSGGDSASAFLWQPGMSGAVASTINGFPYILANSTPDIAGGAYVMAFGDFRMGYTIVDRTGMSVVRDDYTQKKKAIVEFTLNRWNTGQVTLTEAIKLLKVKS